MAAMLNNLGFLIPSLGGNLEGAAKTTFFFALFSSLDGACNVMTSWV